MPQIAAAVVGGIIASRSSSKATKAQQGMNQLAIDENRRQYDLNRADQQPFLEAGQDAVSKLRQALLDGTMSPQDILDQDPGYQFRQEQGEQALERRQAATGNRLGGRGLKEFLRFNQGLSSSAYDKSIARLFTLGGFGPAAANNLGATGSAMSNINSQLYNRSGVAAAQGVANQNNAFQGTLKNLTSLYQYNKGLGSTGAPGGGGGGY